MEEKNAISCRNCGADVKYKPGTDTLKCDYCGTENKIDKAEFAVEEKSLEEYLSIDRSHETMELETVTCPNCGANETFDGSKDSSFCAYCGTPLVTGKTQAEDLLRPDYLLPFKLDKSQALKKTSDWLRGNWFVPGKLKKDAISYTHFKGVYVPHWTYDAATQTVYTGQRGDTYYEEVRRGDQVQRVARTRWSPARRGNIAHFFDDLIVPASDSIDRNFLRQLEPWDLQSLVPFNKDYLRGFVTEKYNVSLKEGFQEARQKIEAAVEQMIRRQIGGDQQRILNSSTDYSNLTFKHVLFPVYISSFLYKGKKYQFVVNSRTGEVQGEKPISKGKVALVVIIGLILLALFYFFFMRDGGGSANNLQLENNWEFILPHIQRTLLNVVLYK